MKTAIKILIFGCLTILCLFVLDRNKQIKQYKIQEQSHQEFLDTLQIEIDSLKYEIQDLLNKIDSIPKPIPVKVAGQHTGSLLVNTNDDKRFATPTKSLPFWLMGFNA